MSAIDQLRKGKFKVNGPVLRRAPSTSVFPLPEFPCSWGAGATSMRLWCRRASSITAGHRGATNRWHQLSLGQARCAARCVATPKGAAEFAMNRDRTSNLNCHHLDLSHWIDVGAMQRPLHLCKESIALPLYRQVHSTSTCLLTNIVEDTVARKTLGAKEYRLLFLPDVFSEHAQLVAHSLEVCLLGLGAQADDCSGNVSRAAWTSVNSADTLWHC